MVQLSLIERPAVSSFDAELAALRHQALARGLPRAEVLRAAEATRARFGAQCAGSIMVAQRRRLTAYFEAVIRNRVLTSPERDVAAIRRRLIEASIEADLVSAGWSPGYAAAQARHLTGSASSAQRAVEKIAVSA